MRAALPKRPNEEVLDSGSYGHAWHSSASHLWKQGSMGTLTRLQSAALPSCELVNITAQLYTSSSAFIETSTRRATTLESARVVLSSLALQRRKRFVTSVRNSRRRCALRW